MNEILTLNIDGITFDCYWDIEEDDHGNGYPILTGVDVGEQNITDIISKEWWDKIEKVVVKHLVEEKTMGYDF